jgi:lysophospholipase L1-like esterase
MLHLRLIAWSLAAVSLIALPQARGQSPTEPAAVVELRGFQFKPGDMVAMVGSTFLEREGRFGYIETALTQAYPTLGLKFRNLAWSADTVEGHARSYFGPPQEGFDRLKGHLEMVKPTVVLCQYGSAEAWAGPAKLDDFVQGYGRLLDMVDAAAGNPRLVLLSPLPAEHRAPAPDPAAYNAAVAVYRDAIRQLAATRGAAFIDAFTLARQLPDSLRPLTENGLHYSAHGHQALGALTPQVTGASAASPQTDEALRALIVEKNRLFFHRWRPANETYLFGFRKHEQGRNGAEMPMFDPLVEQAEKAIASHVAERRP